MTTGFGTGREMRLALPGRGQIGKGRAADRGTNRHPVGRIVGRGGGAHALEGAPCVLVVGGVQAGKNIIGRQGIGGDRPGEGVRVGDGVDGVARGVLEIDLVAAVAQVAGIGAEHAGDAIDGLEPGRIGGDDDEAARGDRGVFGKGEAHPAGDFPLAQIDGCGAGVEEFDEFVDVAAQVGREAGIAENRVPIDVEGGIFDGVIVDFVDDDLSLGGGKEAPAGEEEGRVSGKDFS